MPRARRSDDHGAAPPCCMTYSTTARGLEFMMGYYGLLDRTPLGRNEGDPPEVWVRRHDEYARNHRTSTTDVRGRSTACAPTW